MTPNHPDTEVIFSKVSKPCSSSLCLCTGIRFDAFNVVTGRPQPFGERPDARAEVDQIL